MTTPRYHGGAVSGATRMGERDSLDAPSTLRAGRCALAGRAARLNLALYMLVRPAGSSSNARLAPSRNPIPAPIAGGSLSP